MSTRQYLQPRSGGHGYDLDVPAARPDVFLITCDMIPPEAYQPDDPLREVLATPHLDRLRTEGVNFTNAFSTSPLCGPSRASYLTGRYSYMTVNEERAHDGWQAVLREDDAIFPEYLRAAGYLMRHAGKGHVGTERFIAAFGENDAPWNRWAPPLADDDAYLGYLEALGAEPPVWHRPLTGLRPDRVTPGNSYGGYVRQGNGSAFPADGLYDYYLAEMACERLRRAVRLREGGQPLYLQLDFFSPHQPFMVPEECAERLAELRAAVRLPQTYEEAMAGAGAWPRVYGFYLRNWGLYDPELARDYLAMNLMQVELLDRALGRFLAQVETEGLYDDALIIFTADHGEMNCERGLADKGVYGHPKVARVPLTVRLPRGQRAGTEVADLVSLLDLAPTILETAGITPMDRLDGQSLWPLLRGEDGCGGRLKLGPSGEAGMAEAGRLVAGPSRAARETEAGRLVAGPSTAGDRALLFEAGWHVCPNPAVAHFAELDGRRWMYTYNLCDPHDELYDLDDRTYRDRSADPAVEGVKGELIRRLGAILEADPRWTCYWHTFRLDKFETLGRPEGDFQMYRPQ